MIVSLSFVLFAYLCGSIPFGLILTKLFGKKDIRKLGSGNIGATNVLRTGNKYLAFLTLVFDVLKGFIPVFLALEYFRDMVHLVALVSILGHIFPIWLKFKGGKGVATYLGILLALSIQLSILFMFTWLAVSLIFKYSSLSSMFASFTVFVVNFLRETVIINDINLNSTISITDSKILFIFFILIIFTHKQNILNLKNKTESKIKI